MKTSISILRIATLMALCIGCTVLVCGEASEDAPLTIFLLLKALGFGCGYLVYHLYKEWSAKDNMLMRFDRWCEDEAQAADETPNPMKF